MMGCSIGVNYYWCGYVVTSLVIMMSFKSSKSHQDGVTTLTSTDVSTYVFVCQFVSLDYYLNLFTVLLRILILVSKLIMWDNLLFLTLLFFIISQLNFGWY